MPQRRQRLKLTLRTLLTGVALAALLIGFVPHQLRQSWRKQLRLRGIVDASSRETAFWYDDQYDSETGTCEQKLSVDSMFGRHLTNRVVAGKVAWIRNPSTVEDIARFTSLQRLELKHLHDAVADLAPLASLKELRRLSISYCRVQGLDWSFLSQLKKLTHLNLDHVTFADEDLCYLSELVHLNSLVISSMYITDDAIPDISRIKSLRALRLNQTSIQGQNDTAAALANLRSLVLLRLPETVEVLNPKGFDKLCESLPSCEVTAIEYKELADGEEIKRELREHSW